ncbi:MAG: DNA repair protein RecN [Deltaproteobacteria bacterium]|nr:DNA repair protein RecN [Deltaproteobacteria bacterium]
MLRLLRIRCFAIIDELELEFGKGFNAITGETGAGKSIIMDAVSLILGNRANNDVIRTGADEATVEAIFDLDDSEMLVKRTVHRGGKNKIYINGELATVAQLSSLCGNLVELCSQHENQSLSKPTFQLDLLDRYGGLLEKRGTTRELYSALRASREELATLTGTAAGRSEDFLRFQLKEIEEFDPKEGEEEALLAERRRHIHSAQLLESVAQAAGCLDSSEDDDARTLVGRALTRINKAVELDPALEPTVQALSRAIAELDEAAGLLGSYAQNLEIDAGRAEEVEERLERWSQMKRKYGADAATILAARDRIAGELSDFENHGARIAEVQARIETLTADYAKAARELSKKRKHIAKTLAKTIEDELSELSMPGTRFEIEFSETGEAPDGIDRVQFLFSPNAGEEPKAIAKIASGGELSRVMLAVRRTIADRGGIGVYLFDEIDAGIGGQTATVVGKKLKSVSKFNQIICITHLPQVAAFAAMHYHVTKKVSAGRTQSRIAALEGAARVDELARMLGGLNLTEKSRGHARDLLKDAGARV